MMKRLSFNFLFVFLIISGSTNAFELYRAGARSVALGNTGVTFTGAESLFHNPAGTSGVTKLTFILSAESRFMMKELSVLAAGMVIPTKAGNAGLSHIRFTAGVYCSDRTTISFSRHFGERISAAVAFNSLTERYPEQARATPAITAETGIQIRLNSRCLAGVWVFHPAPFKISKVNRPTLSTLVRAGTSWTLTNALCLLNEINISSGEKPCISTGVEITLPPEVFLRIGWSSRPMNLSGGIGFKLGKTAIDISFYHHGYCGVTPVAGFTFNP